MGCGICCIKTLLVLLNIFVLVCLLSNILVLLYSILYLHTNIKKYRIYFISLQYAIIKHYILQLLGILVTALGAVAIAAKNYIAQGVALAVSLIPDALNIFGVDTVSFLQH